MYAIKKYYTTLLLVISYAVCAQGENVLPLSLEAMM